MPGMRTDILTNLLSFTGLSEEAFDTEWNTVSKWTPESRYRGGVEITDADTLGMILAREIVLKELL